MTLECPHVASRLRRPLICRVITFVNKGGIKIESLCTHIRI